MKISRIQLSSSYLNLHILSLPSRRNDYIHKTIRDSEAITSSDGTFKLGFSSLGNSSNRYIGIWFNNIQEPTVVWVANRDAPLRDSSGVFTIAEDQNFVVLDGKRNVLWKTNVTSDDSSSHVELFDAGNLVLREGNSNGNGRIIWESFNNPSNVVLAKMRLGINQKQIVTSWKSNMDPSAGNYFVELDPVSIRIPQVIIRNGSKRLWRSAHLMVEYPMGLKDFARFIGMDSVWFEMMRKYFVYDSLLSEQVFAWILFEFQRNIS